jgi:hypothetical protein
MRTFKTRARNGTLVVGARIGPAEPDRPLGVRKKRSFSGFCLKACARRSWMMPVSSYIVILNLIANLSFLYHKPEKPAVTRID